MKEKTGPDRLGQLRRLLKEHDCSHILVSDATDVRYVSGFNASNAFLLVSRTKNYLFTDFRYERAANDFCRRNRRYLFRVIDKPGFSFLTPRLPAGNRLGIQSGCITLDQAARLRKALAGVKIVRLGNALSGLAAVKTPHEVAVMRRCAHAADIALAATLEKCTAGITEIECKEILEHQCRISGSTRPAFDTIVLFGARTALPHGTPSGRRLKKGDWILFDFGCTIDDLCSDMTRTFVFQKASARQKKIYDIVLQAQTHVRGRIKAGMSSADADSLARSVIEKQGYGRCFGHASGHGLGYRIHEPPRLAAGNTAILSPGTVVTVEPGIYINRFGGVRIEDMVYLGINHTEILSRFPRQLIEIES